MHEDSEEIVSLCILLCKTKNFNLKKLFALYGIRTQDLYVKFPLLYQLPYGSLDTLHGFHLCMYSKLA